MTHHLDLPTFLADGEIRSKNHPNMQRCYQTSHLSIVNRRGEAEFQTPCGGVVNDYVPFYFSPMTAMAYSVYKRNVDLISPSGQVLGKACMEDRIYFVSNVENFRNTDRQIYFSNISCNQSAVRPQYSNDLDNIENHVNWSLFDDSSKVAHIPEIGYTGVTQFFHDRETPQRYQNRSAQRMAEFLVKYAYPMQFVDCIIAQNKAIGTFAETAVEKSKWNIPVFVKSGCYF